MQSFPSKDFKHVSFAVPTAYPEGSPLSITLKEVRGLAGLALRYMGKCSQDHAWMIFDLQN